MKRDNSKCMMEITKKHLRMIERRLEGTTYPKIAVEFGTTTATVTDIFGKLKRFHGVSIKVSRKPKYFCTVCKVLLTGQAKKLCGKHRKHKRWIDENTPIYFSSKSAYAKWRYHNVPGIKERQSKSTLKWVQKKKATDKEWLAKFRTYQNEWHRKFNQRQKQLTSPII